MFVFTPTYVEAMCFSDLGLTGLLRARATTNSRVESWRKNGSWLWVFRRHFNCPDPWIYSDNSKLTSWIDFDVDFASTRPWQEKSANLQSTRNLRADLDWINHLFHKSNLSALWLLMRSEKFKLRITSSELSRNGTEKSWTYLVIYASVEDESEILSLNTTKQDKKLTLSVLFLTKCQQ